MYTDPIADLLTRIRNSLKAHQENVTVPYSKIKEGIVKILKENNFVEDYKIEEESIKQISIALKERKEPLILKRVSKPGQRIYIKKAELRQIKRGLGISIISTSKGLMTNDEARKQNLGGELICQIY